MKSVLSGGSKRLNYTSKTLDQLNAVTGFFSTNETKIAQAIDTQDADVSYKNKTLVNRFFHQVFLSVVNVLVSEERLSVLKNESAVSVYILLYL